MSKDKSKEKVDKPVVDTTLIKIIKDNTTEIIKKNRHVG